MFGSNRKPSPSLLLKLHTYSPPRLLLPHAYGNVWHVTVFKPVTCTPQSSAAATHDFVIGILVALKQLVAAWPTKRKACALITVRSGQVRPGQENK